MEIFHVTLVNGTVGLIPANSLARARAYAHRYHGFDNVRAVALATKKQIKHVRSMGGYVPSTK